jgi:hypothetical protein
MLMRLPTIGPSTIVIPAQVPRWSLIGLVLVALLIGHEGLLTVQARTWHGDSPVAASMSALEDENHHLMADEGPVSPTPHGHTSKTGSTCGLSATAATIQFNSFGPLIAPDRQSRAVHHAEIGVVSAEEVAPMYSPSVRRALLQVYVI